MLALDVEEGVAVVAERPDQAEVRARLVQLRGRQGVVVPLVGIGFDQHVVAGIEIEPSPVGPVLDVLDAGQQHGRVADHGPAGLQDHLGLRPDGAAECWKQGGGDLDGAESGREQTALRRPLGGRGRAMHVGQGKAAAEVDVGEALAQGRFQMGEMPGHGLGGLEIGARLGDLGADMRMETHAIERIRIGLQNRQRAVDLLRQDAELGRGRAGLVSGGGRTSDFRHDAQCQAGPAPQAAGDLGQAPAARKCCRR